MGSRTSRSVISQLHAAREEGLTVRKTRRGSARSGTDIRLAVTSRLLSAVTVAGRLTDEDLDILETYQHTGSAAEAARILNPYRTSFPGYVRNRYAKKYFPLAVMLDSAGEAHGLTRAGDAETPGSLHVPW